jgi:hypothetical protein
MLQHTVRTLAGKSAYASAHGVGLFGCAAATLLLALGCRGRLGYMAPPALPAGGLAVSNPLFIQTDDREIHW